MGYCVRKFSMGQLFRSSAVEKRSWKGNSGGAMGDLQDASAIRKKEKRGIQICTWDAFGV
jgi:hypothetical protein